MLLKNIAKTVGIKHCFSIDRSKVLGSSYDELAKQIAKEYGDKYKNNSAFCLLELHQQFKIFHPGDWVLDIGAGPHCTWTDLALKLTANQNHKVVSNDLNYIATRSPHHFFVKGRFQQQNVQTNIGLHFQNRPADAILFDVSPEYTGFINKDCQQLIWMTQQGLKFSSLFLKKGGIFVCKMLESGPQKLFRDYANMMFNEVYRYSPSILRRTSPVVFYVLKGYMMSQNYQALKQFLKKYKGTEDNKRKVVNQYRGKFSWDPVLVLKKKITDQILTMYKDGKPSKAIINIYKRQPFVDAAKIVQLIQRCNQAIAKNDHIQRIKIMKELTNNQLYHDADQLPSTPEQFVQMLEKASKQLKQSKSPKKSQSTLRNRKPLKKDEIYMKTDNTPTENVDKIYLSCDLDGEYDNSISDNEAIERQMKKMEEVYPNIKKQIQEQLGELDFNKDRGRQIDEAINEKKIKQKAFEAAGEDPDDQEQQDISELFPTRKRNLGKNKGKSAKKPKIY